jgi:hypothetical protein
MVDNVCCCDVYLDSILGQCMAHRCQLEWLGDMWSSILCLVVDCKWHHPTCLKGYCVDYGTNMLITCPCEEGQKYIDIDAMEVI